MPFGLHRNILHSRRICRSLFISSWICNIFASLEFNANQNPQQRMIMLGWQEVFTRIQTKRPSDSERREWQNGRKKESGANRLPFTIDCNAIQ